MKFLLLQVYTIRRLLILAALGLVLAVVISIRLRLLDLPLERDEGEYAYAGQLILQGVPPYQDAYNMKWPGTYAMYAMIMAIFGQTTVGIHLGLVLVNLASSLLVFLITRRISGAWPGVVAAGVYALLSISPPTLGLAAHATHFVMLFALGGLYLLLDPSSIRRLFFAGILIGLATIMKQTGAAFGLFAVLWISWATLRERPIRWKTGGLRLSALGVGGLLPILAMLGILATTGALDRFWLWTVKYSVAYVSVVSSVQAPAILAIMATSVMSAAPGLWAPALFGLALLFFNSTLCRWRFFLTALSICSFVAICPGWYFRGHYFLLFTPVVGILAGVAVRCLWDFPRKSLRIIALIAFPLGAAHALYISRAIFFFDSPENICRTIYGANPFPEAVKIARYIEDHTQPGATIAVLGSEPEIYFYAHRRSATGYIYTYPLMEPQPFALRMQHEMAAEIESSNPDYLVLVAVPFSWLPRPTSEQFIFEWIDRYREKFNLVGRIEIHPATQTTYDWSPDPDLRKRNTGTWLAIFRNKKLGPLQTSPLPVP